MLENEFFSALKNHVFELFKSALPVQAVYHNFNHTLQVVNAASEIAAAENLDEASVEILLIACWFHDTGYINVIEKHEERSKEIANDYLKKLNFSEEKISKINEVIDATVMPQSPKNQLGEIICDADLFHLGSEDFNKKSNLLRAEVDQLCGQTYTDIEWFEKNANFLGEHAYFTNYAFEKLSEQKSLNLLKIQKDVKKLKAKEQEQQLKLQTKSEEVKRKKRKEDRPDRGIETMFR